jgi:A/G-specific adenine glycosylase
MEFSSQIIAWYTHNKRDLPWRQTKDPYLIWISEIILQQTQVEQGISFYYRFTEKYQNVHQLAEAEEQEVLKIWQGLGYYTRARNMHHTAKYIVEYCNGQFPDNYETLISLRGIGRYTAGAILSLAFNKPYPVVDGNVLRLFTRLYGIKISVNTSCGKKTIESIVNSHLPPLQAGTFNQAIMEFGARQCKPRNPLCQSCPLNMDCVAFQTGTVEELPVKREKNHSRKRFFNYLVILTQEDMNLSFLLKKRSGNDIWKNLYDFPLIETNRLLSAKHLKNSNLLSDIMNINHIQTTVTSRIYKHLLSHQTIFTRFHMFFMINNKKDTSVNGFIKVNFIEVEKYPVPRLIESFLEEYTPVLRNDKKKQEIS